jgi:hypothetical protein
MWYEICLLLIGVICLGVFLVLYTKRMKEERERIMIMNEHMKSGRNMRAVEEAVRHMDQFEQRYRQTKTGLPLVLGLLLMLGSTAWAQGVGSSIGEVCFRLLPFDDVVALNVTQFDLPNGVPGFFTFGVHWIGESPPGNLVYEMDGNGSAGYNPAGDTFTVDIVTWNKTPFFTGEPICRLNGATDGSLTGRWALDCIGRFPPSQGGTPYYAQGTIVNVSCPRVQVASMRTLDMLPVAGMLIGQQ